MQPYFFPYIGYWQLINAVDKFVIYDDVNYIKGGWVNRNRILCENEIRYFNVQMIGASSNKMINQILVNNDKRLIDKKIRMLEGAYKKAPYYEQVMPLLRNVLHYDNENLAAYLENAIRELCKYLDIETELLVSSNIEKKSFLRGQDKVIDICERLQATEYYNAIGGMKLYSYEDFKAHGIELKFLKTKDIYYKQFSDNFICDLSIIDVLMFNSKEFAKRLLGEYTIVT